MIFFFSHIYTHTKHHNVIICNYINNLKTRFTFVDHTIVNKNLRKEYVNTSKIWLVINRNNLYDYYDDEGGWHA